MEPTGPQNEAVGNALHSEESQARSELAQALLDCSDCIALLLTPEGLVIESNRAAVRAAGVVPTGRTLWEALPCTPESAASLRQAVAQAAGGERISIEVSLLRNGGAETRPVTLSLRKAIGEGPEALLLVEGRDVTEERAKSVDAERRLLAVERENTQTQKILAEAPAALGILTGPEHRWTFANQALVRLSGRSNSADFVGKTLLESFPETEDQGFRRLLDQVYRSGESHTGHEMRALLKRADEDQPQEVFLDFTYQPILNSEGAVEEIFVYVVEVTDKVLARQELEEHAERLRLAQDAAQIGTWEWDPIKDTTTLSPQLHRIFGSDPDDQERLKNWFSRIHPPDRNRVELLMYEGHRLGRMDFEYRYQHPDLGLRWLQCKGQRRMSETRMFGMVQDITTRKKAEEAAQQLAAIVASSDDAIISKDLKGIVTSWNPAAERMYGYTAEEMIGQPITKIVPPELYADEARILATIARGERIEHFDTVRMKKDGELIQVSLTVSPVRDENGAIIRASKIARDTSEHRRRDEFRYRLAALVESSEDAIVSKDLNGIVTSWNPAAERLFGFTAEEMIGQPILKIIPPEMYSDETRILTTIARGERIEHFETVRRKKNGEPIEISLTISPIRDETGKVIGAAKIARDITQQKKAERALRTSERLASVGRLAATVAHEINNPLEAVTNLVFLARHTAAKEEVRKYLGMAEEELERVSHLTKQTLGFYRETKGVTEVRLGALVDSLLSVFIPRMRAKGIELCREIDNEVEIRAIPGEIRQVIANLISNSIDAIRGNGQIRVRVSPARRWRASSERGVRFSIADTGSGIPEAIRAQVFEPFFTTKRDVGTGLGLWICKSIVENHRGTIRVWSRTTPDDSGTVFSVFLPLNSGGLPADTQPQRVM
ncbi:MAG: PAS domain S-box protein [Acidobacteriota bacterium]